MARRFASTRERLRHSHANAGSDVRSTVNAAWRTSMEVGVRVEAENLQTGIRRHTNSCYLTFVAIDRNGRPVEVPRLVPETDLEIQRYEAAKSRRRRRLEERTSEASLAET